jgi:hypothetical protein
MQLLEAHTNEGIAVEEVNKLQQKLKVAGGRGGAE